MSKRIRYHLILEAGKHPVEPAIRLRKLLKIAGRQLGLPCIEVKEMPPPQVYRKTQKTKWETHQIDGFASYLDTRFTD